MRATPARSSYQPRSWEGVAGVVHLLMHGKAMCRGRGLRIQTAAQATHDLELKPGHHWIGYAEGLHGMNAVPPTQRCEGCWKAFELWWEGSDEADAERRYLQEWHRMHGLPVNPGLGREPTRTPLADLGGMHLEADSPLEQFARRGQKAQAAVDVIVSGGPPKIHMRGAFGTGPVVISSQAELDKLLGEGFSVFPADAPPVVVTFPLPPEAAECERYLGIDPGLAHLGVFVLGLTATSVRCLHRETFETSPANGTDDERLRLVARRLNELVSYWRPVAIGYEDVRAVTTGKETRRTGHSDSGPLLMVCGMVILSAWLHGDLPCYRVASSSARVAVLGKGKTRGSSKQSVRDKLQEITGTKKLTLDQADAGAVAFGAFAKHRPPPPRKGKR